MIDFFLAMSLPVLLAVVALFVFKRKIVWWEFALMICVPALIVGAVLCTDDYSKVTDTEILNGQVLTRYSEKVSCSHSYQCHCHTVTSGSGKNRTTSTECDTCYEHRYDVNWLANTSVGTTYDFGRVDSQGLQMPQRYREAYVGEPYSETHAYQNYILANPDGVLLGGRGDLERFGGGLPDYPGIYNDYRTHHFIQAAGMSGMDQKTWDYVLDEANKVLGPQKQVNVLLIVAKTNDHRYFDALRDRWKGSKKNDVVVVIGSLDGHKIEWVDVLSWSTIAALRVKIRDGIEAIGWLDQRDAIVQLIHSEVVADFQRLHMKTMQYLMAGVRVSGTELMAMTLFGTVLEGLLIWFCVKNDVNLEEPNRPSQLDLNDRFIRRSLYR